MTIPTFTLSKEAFSRITIKRFSVDVEGTFLITFSFSGCEDAILRTNIYCSCVYCIFMIVLFKPFLFTSFSA